MNNKPNCGHCGEAFGYCVASCTAPHSEFCNCHSCEDAQNEQFRLKAVEGLKTLVALNDPRFADVVTLTPNTVDNVQRINIAVALAAL